MRARQFRESKERPAGLNGLDGSWMWQVERVTGIPCERNRSFISVLQSFGHYPISPWARCLILFDATIRRRPILNHLKRGELVYELLGRSPTSMPDDLFADGSVCGTARAARQQPDCRFPPKSTIMLSQLLEQARTEHQIPVLATFAFLDVKHHARGIDVGNLQGGH